jgi:hypothetical protein
LSLSDVDYKTPPHTPFTRRAKIYIKAVTFVLNFITSISAMAIGVAIIGSGIFASEEHLVSYFQSSQQLLNLTFNSQPFKLALI